MTELISINYDDLSDNYVDKIQNLCRLCLLQSKELELDSDSYLPDKKWIDILINVTNNKYVGNNRKEYPQGICEECSSKLVLFYKFKQKVDTSHSTLEAIFRNYHNFMKSNEKNEHIETIKDKVITYIEVLEDFIEEVDSDEDENKMLIEENNIQVDNSCLKVCESEESQEIEINECNSNESTICYLQDAEEDHLFFDNELTVADKAELHDEIFNFNEHIYEDESNNFVDSIRYDKKGKSKNIQCEICGAKFTRNSSLKQHATVHSKEKNYECNLCLKKFTRRAHVDIHMLIHSNIRPHSCDVCGRAFTKSGDLKRHKKIHSDVYDFMCLICNKEFKRKEYLASHINSHYDVKPHKCQYCSKTYQSVSGLIKHKKSVHSHKENI